MRWLVALLVVAAVGTASAAAEEASLWDTDTDQQARAAQIQGAWRDSKDAVAAKGAPRTSAVAVGADEHDIAESAGAKNMKSAKRVKSSKKALPRPQRATKGRAHKMSERGTKVFSRNENGKRPDMSHLYDEAKHKRTHFRKCWKSATWTEQGQKRMAQADRKAARQRERVNKSQERNRKRITREHERTRKKATRRHERDRKTIAEKSTKEHAKKKAQSEQAAEKAKKERRKVAEKSAKEHAKKTALHKKAATKAVKEKLHKSHLNEKQKDVLLKKQCIKKGFGQGGGSPGHKYSHATCAKMVRNAANTKHAKGRFDRDMCLKLCTGLLNKPSKLGKKPKFMDVWKKKWKAASDKKRRTVRGYNWWSEYRKRKRQFEKEWNRKMKSDGKGKIPGLNRSDSLADRKFTLRPGQTRAYYTAAQRKVSITALQRCCLVCSAKQQLADSCGGETLGQKRSHHNDDDVCGRFNVFQNKPEIRKRLVETSALPPPGGPKTHPCGGATCGCPMRQVPKGCAQSWNRYFDMCKPQSLGRATCVKRTDVDKKAHLLSACRGGKKQEELFIYSHVMVKATGCRVQGKNQQCRGDLAKIASTKACYGPNLSGNRNGSEPKKGWCKFVKPPGRGGGRTVSRSFSGMRVFRVFRRVGPAERSSKEKLKKAKEKNAKKKEKKDKVKEKKEKAKHRKRDACVKKLQDATRKLRHSKSARMSCSVRTSSQVYRICWCKDKRNCSSIDNIDQRYCWWAHKGEAKSKDPQAQKCLSAAREWYRAGALQSLDMVQW